MNRLGAACARMMAVAHQVARWAWRPRFTAQIEVTHRLVRAQPRGCIAVVVGGRAVLQAARSSGASCRSADTIDIGDTAGHHALPLARHENRHTPAT